MDIAVLKTHVYCDISRRLKLKVYLGGILDGTICVYTVVTWASPALGVRVFLLERETQLLPPSRRTSRILIARQLS